ncbi:MAG TPA: hypothetical protein VLW48_01945 [Candidatus Bathyarchaeia archaeon]|nr:hypothetical protein [Candidatus Bathyarchaeia archaeon]
MDNPTSSQAEDLTKSGAEVSFTRLPAVRVGPKELSDAQASTVFLVGLALICAVTTLIGAVPTRMFGHDTFIPLEMGWRVLHGQRPHVDFVSGWGPVWFLLSALGLVISRHSVDGIGYANAIMGMLVGSWSFLLSKGRLLPLWRVVLSLFLVALVVAPYPLGNSPLMSSHAMVYNRYGYALLGLVLVECLEPARDSEARVPHPSFFCLGGFCGGISTGAALSLALFLKVSFFLVGAGIVAVLALVTMSFGPRRVLGMAAGFGAVSLALLAYLRFDLLAMLRDLRMAGAARSAAFTTEGIANKLVSRPSALLLVVLFAWVSALLLPRWRGWRLPLVGALMFAADLAIIMTNQQWDGFVLCACFGILIANELMREQQQEPAAKRPLYAGALCLAALLFVPQFAGDLFGLGYGLWSKEGARSEVDIVRLTPPNLAPLVLYDGHIPRSNGRVLANYVNDGVALLERDSRPDETILSLDMTNPFPYALERRPARGGVASPTYHFNLDDEHRPSDDEFFGDADIVMVPKHPALDDFFYKDFLRAYEPGIHQRYTLAAESAWWWMYRRK